MARRDFRLGEPARREVESLRVSPQALELEILPRALVEHVHDDIEEIQKHPAPLRQALDRVCVVARRRQLVVGVPGGRLHLRVGAAGGDHEEVAHVGAAAQVEDDHVIQLLLQEVPGAPLGQRVRRRIVGDPPLRDLVARGRAGSVAVHGTA